ncbi:hypothetical protein HPB51_011779 [Rhipicephalus microplus]|uniref:C2H2-type domain-containing protein n=1 Tax=Rhipicephalus microplus TaxID=6941 RepID=A0A9J6E0G6_RHIMP|nr:hypothetical protein HPB51_011779 [Rhipicephalus microplus]
MDPARPSSARGRRARRRHAAAPTGSPAPPPPQRPRRGTPGSPAAGPSSPASTASPSSGPAGSEAPASSRPSAPVQPRQPALDGDVLWVYLPAPAELQCPVDNCSMRYSGAAWTSRAQSVRRHVEFEHGVRVRERIYVCTVCDAPLTSRPSYHHCLARATLVPSTETPRRRCGVCDATFTTKRGLANHLRCHVDQAGPSGAARERAPARRVRHVSTSSSDTSSSGSGSSSPPAAPRASRRLRGLSPSDASPPVRPSSSPAARSGASSPASVGEPSAFMYQSSSGSSTSVGSASVPGSPAPSPAASPAPSEQPFARRRKHVFTYAAHRGLDACRRSRGLARPWVTTVAGSCVTTETLVVHQASPGTVRLRALVVVQWRVSCPARLVGGFARWRCRVSTGRRRHDLLRRVAVSSPPLDAGSSPVVLPGSPVSPASSPVATASVDRGRGGSRRSTGHPETDSTTLQMPPTTRASSRTRHACSAPCCGTPTERVMGPMRGSMDAGRRLGCRGGASPPVGPGVTSSRRRPPGLAAKEVFQPPGSCRSSLQSLASGPGPSCSVTPAPCLATHGPGPRLLPRLLPSRRLPLCYQISDPAPAEPVY